MNNITLDCPNCNEPEKAVGNPNEANHGWDGKWFCFHCLKQRNIRHGVHRLEGS